MAIWTPANPTTTARELAEALATDIGAGRLPPGTRLPPQRALAHATGVSPNTVLRAYAEVTRRGLIGGEVGRGTFVRPPPAPPSPPLLRPESGPIDLAQNLPFLAAAQPALAATLAAIGNEPGLETYLDRMHSQIEARHRRSGATWLSLLGVPADPDRIIITCGAQHGVFATLLALLRPGDTLLVERLTYAPLRAIAEHLALRLVPLAMDEHGLVPAALAAACRTARPAALYCTPTLQTPTATTMPEPRRREIAAIAMEHQLTIIEDDLFGLLPVSRPPPIAASAPDRTVLISGLSKSVAPGLRVGYAQAPAAMVAPIRAAVALSCWAPPPLMAEIATRWIEDGTATELNAAQRAHATHRQTMAHRLLRTPAAQGLHLWLPLPPPWTGKEFAAAANRAGVLLQPASAFLVGAGPAPAAVRICLSHEPTDTRVAQGLETLARLLAAPPEPIPLVI